MKIADNRRLCPSTSNYVKVVHCPKLCHPERTRISYFTALPAATYAALREESRMKSTEAMVFDRKSGGAEGPAVRPSLKQLPTKLSTYFQLCQGGPLP
jgi:hypothetical protein